MAVGNVVFSGNKKSVQLIAGATGDTAAPSLASDGVATYSGKNDDGITNTSGGAAWVNRYTGDYVLNLHTTNGSSPQVNVNMWGYQAHTGLWYFVGNTLNVGTAPNQSQIRASIAYRNLGVYDRLYAQISGTVGTLGAAGLHAWLSSQPES